MGPFVGMPGPGAHSPCRRAASATLLRETTSILLQHVRIHSIIIYSRILCTLFLYDYREFILALGAAAGADLGDFWESLLWITFRYFLIFHKFNREVEEYF